MKVPQWFKDFCISMDSLKKSNTVTVPDKTEFSERFHMTDTRPQSPLEEQTEECRDWPDTHAWSDDYKEFDEGRTVTRYCTKCGLTAISHTLRLPI